MFNHIPVGVGSKGVIPMAARDLEEALEMGMDWSLREGYVWAEDKEHCEEYGRMLQADSSKVSFKVQIVWALKMLKELLKCLPILVMKAEDAS